MLKEPFKGLLMLNYIRFCVRFLIYFVKITVTMCWNWTELEFNLLVENISGRYNLICNRKRFHAVCLIHNIFNYFLHIKKPLIFAVVKYYTTPVMVKSHYQRFLKFLPLAKTIILLQYDNTGQHSMNWWLNR